jgi:hypothetical protein
MIRAVQVTDRSRTLFEISELSEEGAGKVEVQLRGGRESWCVHLDLPEVGVSTVLMI